MPSMFLDEYGVTSSQVAAAAGTHLLASVPDGYAIRLYDIRTDSILWVALRSVNGDRKLSVWEADPLSEGDGCERSPFGLIKPIEQLTDAALVKVHKGAH